METKKCSFCGEVKPITEFNKYKASKDGYYYYCREYQREIQRENRARMKASRIASSEIIEDGETLTPEQVRERWIEQKPIEVVPVKAEKRVEKVVVEGRSLVRETIDLSTISNRQLLEELKKRGYIWSDMFLKQRVDYNKI